MSVTTRDPVLDADGYNKPAKRRGVYSDELSRELALWMGKRVVAYRDHNEHRLVDKVYIFVEGSRARFVGTLAPYNSYDTAGWIATMAKKISGHLDRNLEYSSADLRDARAQLIGVFFRLEEAEDDQYPRTFVVPA